jgi:hypothetical protein
VNAHIRELSTFDRSLYEATVDFGTIPYFAITRSGTDTIYSVAASQPPRIVPKNEFDQIFRRIVSLSREQDICIRIDDSLSIREVREITSWATGLGALNVKLMVSPQLSATDSPYDGTVSEFLLGPSRELGWYRYEWYIQSAWRQAHAKEPATHNYGYLKEK